MTRQCVTFANACFFIVGTLLNETFELMLFVCGAAEGYYCPINIGAVAQLTSNIVLVVKSRPTHTQRQEPEHWAQGGVAWHAEKQQNRMIINVVEDLL